jgi:hypothetical protein
MFSFFLYSFFFSFFLSSFPSFFLLYYFLFSQACSRRPNLSLTSFRPHLFSILYSQSHPIESESTESIFGLWQPVQVVMLAAGAGEVEEAICDSGQSRWHRWRLRRAAVLGVGGGGGDPQWWAVQICATPTASSSVPTLLLLPALAASPHSVVVGMGLHHEVNVDGVLQAVRR